MQDEKGGMLPRQDKSSKQTSRVRTMIKLGEKCHENKRLEKGYCDCE